MNLVHLFKNARKFDFVIKSEEILLKLLKSLKIFSSIDN
jgi:hypothetical protein